MDRGPISVSEELRAWEKEYLRRGAVWGGAVHHLPVLPPGSHVLELGCGNGKTLSAMIQRNWDVTAIDFSACAARMSRMITTRLGKGTVCIADAIRLPFCSLTFDAVFAIHLLSHLHSTDRIRAAEEAVRVLKPGGTLYFSGFSVEDFRSLKGSGAGQTTIRTGSGISTHFFCEGEVKDLFSTLTLHSLTTERWSMRVRGHDLPRAEVQALFTK
jgi:SAM-dependent methyltransferase